MHSANSELGKIGLVLRSPTTCLSNISVFMINQKLFYPQGKRHTAPNFHVCTIICHHHWHSPLFWPPYTIAGYCSCLPGHNEFAPSQAYSQPQLPWDQCRNRVMSAAGGRELTEEMEVLPVMAFSWGFAHLTLKQMPPLTGDTIIGTRTSQGQLCRPSCYLTIQLV